MRPIRLEVLGLTSYKEPVCIDFSDLDLFAITGPTGSGKSSIVDAITFALFGQMPRVGRGIKDLISLGSDRMSVKLEFSADGERYRIFRETSKRGQKAPQLERFHEDRGEFLPEDVDRIKDTNAYIEHLLRLNYDAFIRSVLLPQGEFQEFLAGDRNQRREVLNRLLRLGVYAVMQQKANTLAREEGDEAERIRDRLETELADATIEALAAAQDELAALEQEASQIGDRRKALGEASRAVEQLAAALARAQKGQREAELAGAALEEAQKTLAGGEKSIAELDRQLTEVRAKAAASEYDAELHLKLTAAVTDARERDAIEARLVALGAEGEKIREELARIQSAASEARTRVTEAHAASEGANDAFETLRRTNATAVLRTALKQGDQCPVCGQPVAALAPEADDAETIRRKLDHARADLEAARNEEKKAEQAAAAVEREAAVLAERGTRLDQQLADVKADEVRRAASLVAALGDAKITTGEIRKRISALEAATQALEALGRRERELVDQREKSAQGLLSAQSNVATLEAQAESRKRDLEEAEKEAADSRAAIHRLATDNRWEDALETLDTGGDVAAIVRQDLESARQRETTVNQEIGACRTRIEMVKQNIALAEELRVKEKEHGEAARLGKDLASILRADGLPAFVRDSAMQALAAGASTWLRKVSAGRYDLKVEGQDFCVADLLNAGEERPVQTLSGGETFLASLSLALALAEQLPGMSSDGDATTLESLFIDEGFSHLDEDTLKTVADALEVLGADRRRLIGVITHVSALAERLPARIIVHKDSAGGPSRVTIE